METADRPEAFMTIRVPFHLEQAPLHVSPAALAVIATVAALLILLASPAH